MASSPKLSRLLHWWFAIISGFLLLASSMRTESEEFSELKARAVSNGNVTLGFEANLGQIHDGIDFLARGNGLFCIFETFRSSNQIAEISV